MSFAIDRGFAEVLIQKKNETSPISRTMWNILKQKKKKKKKKKCIRIYIDML